MYWDRLCVPTHPSLLVNRNGYEIHLRSTAPLTPTMDWAKRVCIAHTLPDISIARSQNDNVIFRSMINADTRIWSKYSWPIGNTVSVASGSGGEASSGGGTKNATWDLSESRHCQHRLQPQCKKPTGGKKKLDVRCTLVTRRPSGHCSPTTASRHPNPTASAATWKNCMSILRTMHRWNYGMEASRRTSASITSTSASRAQCPSILTVARVCATAILQRHHVVSLAQAQCHAVSRNDCAKEQNSLKLADHSAAGGAAAPNGCDVRQRCEGVQVQRDADVGDGGGVRGAPGGHQQHRVL